MKSKTTSTVKPVIVSFLLLFSFSMMGQVKKAFTPRYSETIKGDVTIIANNVLSRHATNAYNGTDGNHDFSNNVFVDIDSDASTFNSSSANFSNPEPSLSCLNFKKVLLYWAAADKEYSVDDNTGNGGAEPVWNYNQVKLMLPGQSSYSTITADEVIYRGRDEHFVNDPYICVKDITSDVSGLANPYGNFQVANVKATEGDLYSHTGSHTGTSGGWQIVFVYENPSMIGKNITLFDGYVHITQTQGEVEFDFNGFQTVPTGNVNADIVLGSFEGDRDISGDQLQIFDTNSTWSNISTPIRDSNNFFNSRITIDGTDFTDRNPASTNTLGFDAAVFDLQNTGNKFIDNNQTSATLKITSDQESYGLYLLGLSVEVYEPSLGALNFTSSTSGTGFNPGDNVQMTLSVENSGNDDIQNLEIYTTLPQEVDFVNTESLPAGVTYNFNTSTRELRFFVPDGNTDVGDPLYTLDFNVQIKDQCHFLETACSANFAMQATATFSGVTNTNPVVAQSSGTLDSCGIGNFDPTVVDINEPNQVNWSTAANALDTTVSCDDSDALNAAQNLEPATEFCNFTLNKVAGSFVADPSCPGEGTYTNTWTFTDACGRTSDTFTQVITVEDNAAPTFVETLPTDTTVSCDSVPVADVLTATDNCDNSVAVTFDEQITDGDSCPSDYIITRTWSVEDCAGNTTEHVQTITVEDITAPTFVETLPSDTVAAYNAIPSAETLTANDNCDTNAGVSFSETYIGDNTSTTYTIVRTWTASDCTGNSIDHTQQIFVTENGDPVGLYINDITVDEDAGNATLEVFHVGEVIGGFTVNHTTADGTAVESLDYSLTSGTLNFNGTHGELVSISVPINDDNIIEATEAFTVQLSNGSNTPAINDNSGEITINDNDGGAGNGVSVAGFSVNEDAGTADFVLSLNANVQGGFNVDFDVADGTAIAGSDYTVASATGNIAFAGNAGEQHSVTVTILDDTLIENSEDLSITISNLSTGLIGILNANATGTINDNDGGAGNGVSVAGFSVDEDAGTADFVLSLNADVQGGFNVDFDVADGTAIAGSDYTVASATGNIAFAGNAGEQHSVTVTILDDSLIENSEDLTITISNLSTGLISIIDGNATGTIGDNDGGAGNGVSVAGFSVDEDAGTADFVLSLNADVQGGFNVDFAVADGTAIAGSDYTVASATGNIAFAGNAGEQHSVTVTILDDTLIENSEDLTITISNLSTGLIGILNANAVGTINDNDGGAGNGVSVAGFNVDEDAGTADFVLSLNADVQGGFDLDFAVADGTAIAGSDYTVASATGNITFAGNAGEQHNVTVTILDDSLIENSEDLSIALSNLSTGLIGILNANAVGTINDNDGGAGNGVSVAGFSVDEDAGTADFVLSLNADVQGGFDVDFAVADGTAIAGSDYTVASATGNIAFAGNAGEQHSVTVTILDDSLIENSEDLTITISNLSTGLIGILNANATGTINDNDGGAGNGVSVAGFSVDEDAGTADFVLSLNADVQGGFNVDFAVADGTAIAGDDYTVASATGNIAFAGNAGEQHSVTVTILDDTLIENSEDLSIALSNLSTGLIGILNANAVGTINDNDGGAGNGVSVAGFSVDEDAGTADFVLSLNANVQGGFNVDFAVADGTAIAGSDYTVASATGNIVFAGNAGEQHSVTVTILDDSLIENSEDLSIALSNLSTGLIGILNANAVGTINDNDGGAGNGVSVAGFSVDEDAGTADFVLSLNANVQGGFNVDFAIADGTAIAGSDYTVASATGNIVFAGNAGEQHSVTVTILDDTLIENSEDLSIALSKLSTGLISIIDGNATGTIGDNDGGAGNGVSVAGFSVDEDAGTADFVLSLNANVQGGFNVDFAVADGTAIAGSDYTVASATGNIAFAGNAGEQHSVTVTILDDTLIENSEDLSIALSNLSTGLISIIDGNATGTIGDNDGGAGNGVSVAGFSVDEDAGTADFVLSLNANVQGGFNVDFAVADGTAIAGDDYTVASASGNITFAGNAGEQHSVTVTILDDSLIENSEDLSIALSNLSTGLISIVGANAVGTIGDNDGGAGNGVSVAGFSVNEDAGTADFVLSLNANVQGGFNVDFAVADGTAIAGSDYTVASATGNIAFAGNAGEQHSVTVTILDDTLIENSEDLSITISNLSTGLIGILNANAVGTINDNDGGAGNGVSVAGFSVDEDAGTADFVLSLNADVQGGFDIDFTVADGTAIAGSDYTVASATGNITFAGNAGEQHSVTVTILDDTLIENSEDLSIALSNLSTGLISIVGANAVGTIGDNDGGAGNGVSVAGFSVNEDAGTADFVLSLNANVQGGFNVDFAVADGTAIAGSDYTVASATGNIAFAGNAGEQHSVTVTILDDTLIENSEDLTITISNLSTGLIGILNANATGTINDNDGGAGNGVSVAGFSVDEDAGTADFVLSLNADVQGGFNVDFDVADGTAIAGSDYTVASATGNIAFAGNAGEQHSVTVTILDDSLIENSEDLTITISNLSTGLISIIDGNATGTIGDNDGGAGNGVSVAGFSVDEDAGTADFVLSLNADVQGGFNVDFAVADGTAIAGSDYTVASATGNIAFAGNAGEQHSVTVTILDDTLIENSEDLTITISNLSTGLIGILNANAVGTINDNDGGAGNGVSVAGFNVDEDAGTADFVLSLNADVQGGFDLDFAVADGTAIAGSDYTVASATGNITFAGNAGEQHSVTVTILDDSLIENSEDLSIALSNLSTGLIGILNANAVGTINDNDGGAGNGVSVAGFSVDEDAGTADFVLSLNADVQGGFNVDFAVADGTAIAGSDYTVASATGNIAFAGNAGEQHSVTVTILDDSLIENSEDLSITISNLSTGLIGILNANATGTINDNDGGAGNGVSVAGFSVDEDAGTADFVLSLNADVQGGFNVDFDVADGTAIAGSDYTVASATGNIAFAGNAGEQHSVTVTILDDSLIENSEDLTITISNLSTGLISIIDGNATGTIGDNDGGAGNGVSVAGFSVDEDAGTADFVLSLNADVQGGFNVDFAVADGTAIAGSDYTVASATGNIAFAGNAGEQHSVTVTILDDTLIENSEDLTITISNLSTGLISIIDGNATGTIGDNDGGAGNGVQFDITNINIDEDAGTVSVPVSLNVDVQDEFTVEFYTTNGSAQDAFDYTGIPQNTQVLTFGAANSNNQNIIIPIIDDIIIESTEDFQVVLTNISTTLVNILANDTATVNIIDNDGNEGYPTDITLEACDTIPTAEVITVNSTCATTVDFNESITGQDDGCAMDYTITRTWTFTDCVGNVREHVQVITVIDTQAPSFVEVLPTDITVSCDNIPVADVLTAIDSCDPNITVVFDEQITDTDSCESNYIITRTWDAADCAGNPISHTQVITVEDTTAPTFVEALPMDVTVSCDAIPTAEILTATDNCDPNITVVFDEQITDSDSCGSDYIITRTWSTADCAGNPVSHTQVITVEDTTAPTFVETLPLDITVSCDNVPTAEILTAMDNCDPSITVVFDEQITDSDSCGSDYIITRTWSTADCAGNPVSHTQEITVEDTQAPQFVENLPQSMTAMCNEVPDAIVLTAIDNCDTTTAVTFDEIITNDSNCATGYTVTRTWSTEDCAGNVNTHTQVITIEPTGPITSSAYEEEINLICGDEIPEVPQLTFMGGCGNYQVEFSEETVSLADTEDFMITRTWDVTDSCGNTASFEQVIFVMQPQPEEVEINICVEDDAINLINYLPESFDTNGVFELISGNVVLDGSIFNPANLEVGEYLISYSSTEGTCKYYVDFTIIVNSDCVPCGRDEIIVSKTVTANGDNINDMFTITGVEYCNYSFELMIFNRWGDKVYESKNYQNDWGGFAPSNAFGNSGMLPSGTYYYIINVINTDIKPLNGYIYLGTGAN